uniref:PPIase cyclophilin-type domain-containing protein n=1 Tax=Coccolithus braarudii TaxID=221442 RepID=A0A7S0PZ94_9EUKA|mmetsp:Transcript_16080/g.34902  ORF Transcript_16080/g.34902 Transcript_16080/m.34902 type:complete len:275 (+) Transcript_16080:37-861(+)
MPRKGHVSSVLLCLTLPALLWVGFLLCHALAPYSVPVATVRTSEATYSRISVSERTTSSSTAGVASRASHPRRRITEEEQGTDHSARKQIAGIDQAVSPPEAVSIEFVMGSGTKHRIHVRLRPDLSQSSVDFMIDALSKQCAGEFYRSESFLMQGKVNCMSKVEVTKGLCPPTVKEDLNRKCPSHDQHCGCHGPIMTRGMVGWAGGSAGPDFFIYTGDAPATHWSTDHTVFGELVGDASWDAIAALRKLPTRNQGMKMLVQSVPITVMPAGVAG